LSAIHHAVLIVGWQENLLEKEMPPKWMWTLDEELNQHFEELHRRRGSDPDDDDEPEPVGPMLVNEYAKSRGRNLR
jgi:hypothetical protein